MKRGATGMKLSLGQAAKEAGVSKATISRAVKQGKISAEKVGNQYEIDPAELFRVYPRNVSETAERNDAQPQPNAANDTEIRMLREMLNAKDQHIDDLKSELQQAHKEKQALLAAPARRRRIFGLF